MVAQLKKTIPDPTSIDTSTLTQWLAVVNLAKSLLCDAFAAA
jgi:hypothetical protein